MLDWRRGDDPRDATVAPASCVQRRDYFFADFAGATVDAPRDDELSWSSFENFTVLLLLFIDLASFVEKFHYVCKHSI